MPPEATAPNGDLGPAGDPELPHDEHVEGRVQGARHLRRRRDAPARQAEHEHVLVAQVGQRPREDRPGLTPVVEDRAPGHGPPGLGRIVMVGSVTRDPFTRYGVRRGSASAS